MTEWRGPDALSSDDVATAFWNQVSKPAKADDYAVGKVCTLEVAHDGEVLARKMIRVTEVVKDDKGVHVQFEYLPDGEPYEDSGLVIIAPAPR